MEAFLRARQARQRQVFILGIFQEADHQVDAGRHDVIRDQVWGLGDDVQAGQVLAGIAEHVTEALRG